MYSAIVSTAVNDNNEIEVDSVDPDISVGDIVTGEDSSGNPFVASITTIEPGTPSITVSSKLDISANEVLTIYGKENKLGWYSYKIVVKQQEQEYYNVYLPMIVNGIPAPKIKNAFFPTTTTNNTGVSNDIAYTTLFSDNINKIPAELEEVQPEQTQFRTSNEILFPRVGPTNSVRYVYPPTSSGFASPIVQPVQYNVGQKFITADRDWETISHY